MLEKKKEHPIEKTELHPRNRHRRRYDFTELIGSCPELARFAALNIYDDESIDFSNAEAVKMLNRALLKHFYGIENWDIPPNYLCPPIPGRADYIHHIADLLAEKNKRKIPTGSNVKCLDIGVGANCIYPIIGHQEYGWSFIGSDIDPVAIANARRIVEDNPTLSGAAEFRLQTDPNKIFQGIIDPDEFIDVTICNPPFNASLAEARSGTLRKLSNLNKTKVTKAELNFGGQNRELWCEGGEAKFAANLIRESRLFSGSCFWFSTAISKQSNLKGVYAALQKAKAFEVKTIPVAQGNKIGRIAAWTFLDEKQQKLWRDLKWDRRRTG